MKKKVSIIILVSTMVLFLGACSNKKNENSKEKLKEQATFSSTKEKESEIKEESSTEIEIQPAESEKSEGNDSVSSVSLNEYSEEQIEYSRVWLQLMEEIMSNEAYTGLETLYVDKMDAGAPLNGSEDTDLYYPVDVVKLSGSRKIDGNVTYKSNKDGTITVYDFPVIWDNSIKEYLEQNKISPSTYAQSIISDGHIVEIGIGNSEKIKDIIDVMVIR